MNTIRLPLRFTKTSFQMETIEDGSDEYYATLIGYAIQIEPNSLPISTFYGTNDPTFDLRQTGKVGQEIGKLIPEILVTDVNVVTDNNGTSNLSIKFERTNR